MAEAPLVCRRHLAKNCGLLCLLPNEELEMMVWGDGKGGGIASFSMWGGIILFRNCFRPFVMGKSIRTTGNISRVPREMIMSKLHAFS